ncbi:MAG TPA: cellulose synthase subunit BcsC-related outer membrane protein [Bryobacteraceae bacterium]|nr:cellulose synthase subunit BcsC-related outer membrane protein [Bryobacteraceae bacterium]
MRTNLCFVSALAILTAGSLQRLSAADAKSDDSGIDRPVTSQEVQQLKQEISDYTSSSVEGIFDYHTETGDLNNRLDFLRYGARVNYKWSPDSTLYFRALGTSYMTTGRVFDEQAINLTAGIHKSVSESTSVQFEAGASRFTTSATTVNALGSLEFKTDNGSSLYLRGSRTNVEESLLSASGIRPTRGPFAGQLVGLVMDNRGLAGGVFKITSRFDVSAEGGGGVRTGENVESNLFKTASAGAGFNLVAEPDDSPVTLLRASYGLDYFGFDKNLLGYGGVSLMDARGLPLLPAQVGGDNISPLALSTNPGVGGYFSPAQFVSSVARVELRGRPNPAFEYQVSGFIGTQDYTGSERRRADGFFASVTLRLSDRFSLPVTYLRDNFGPFVQQSLFLRLVARL